MNAVETRRLIEHAARCSGSEAEDGAIDASMVESIDQLLARLCSTREAWLLRPGAKLARTRRFLLRLLAPFADRSNDNARNLIMLVALLSDEVASLRARIEEMERRAVDSREAER